MPEAETGVEQLVDELLQYTVLQDSLCTSPKKPWKVDIFPIFELSSMMVRMFIHIK